jgi:hypothetical protein
MNVSLWIYPAVAFISPPIGSSQADPKPPSAECTLGFGAHPSSGLSGHGRIDMRRSKPFSALEHPLPIDEW